MKDWMYWNRDDDGRWIKVFVSIRSEFLCLYQDSDKISKPFIYLAIANVECPNMNSFRIYDINSAYVDLYPYNNDNDTYQKWTVALIEASEMTKLHFDTFVFDMKNLSKKSLYHGSLIEYNKSKSKPVAAQLISSTWRKFVMYLETFME